MKHADGNCPADRTAARATRGADLPQQPGELAEILAGLSAEPRQIAPKYFYDERGSRLFDAITELPEYYLTTTEIGIMRAHVADIAALVGRQASLIEFGSGSSVKTRILLEHLESLAAYVPVDISAGHLLESAAQLRREFPHIEVLPVVADFTQPFELPTPRTPPRRNIVYFPGSTIGNLEYADAVDLLAVMYLEAGRDGGLLIGVDLQKDPALIEAAYNDSAGVTATYDADAGRVVIRLVSRRDQVARLGGRTLRFRAGDAILTEYSHKYTLESFAAMARQAGFEVAKVWMDEDRLFSVQYLVRA